MHRALRMHAEGQVVEAAMVVGPAVVLCSTFRRDHGSPSPPARQCRHRI